MVHYYTSDSVLLPLLHRCESGNVCDYISWGLSIGVPFHSWPRCFALLSMTNAEGGLRES
jgi:hypothetical protein